MVWRQETEDLDSTIIKIASIFNISVLPIDINHIFYFRNRKAVLVKFNKVSLRDRIMAEYFKIFKIFDVIVGEIGSRVYLNDHYSPAGSKMNTNCKKKTFAEKNNQEV